MPSIVHLWRDRSCTCLPWDYLKQINNKKLTLHWEGTFTDAVLFPFFFAPEEFDSVQDTFSQSSSTLFNNLSILESLSCLSSSLMATWARNSRLSLIAFCKSSTYLSDSETSSFRFTDILKSWCLVDENSNLPALTLRNVWSKKDATWISRDPKSFVFFSERG